MKIAPELSDIFEKHAGRVAVIGLANDDIFNQKKEHNIKNIRTFIENHNESFRYPSYIDTEDHLVRDCKYF